MGVKPCGPSSPGFAELLFGRPSHIKVTDSAASRVVSSTATAYSPNADPTRA